MIKRKVLFILEFLDFNVILIFLYRFFILGWKLIIRGEIFRYLYVDFNFFLSNNLLRFYKNIVWKFWRFFFWSFYIIFLWNFDELLFKKKLELIYKCLKILFFIVDFWFNIRSLCEKVKIVLKFKGFEVDKVFFFIVDDFLYLVWDFWK